MAQSQRPDLSQRQVGESAPKHCQPPVQLLVCRALSNREKWPWRVCALYQLPPEANVEGINLTDREAAIGDPHRFQLIDQVRSGEISPEYAEKEAARLGLVPIEYRPDPSEFDPMKERFWTFPMTVAWIAYRTAEAVRENWNDYTSNCSEWRFCDELNDAGRSGFDLFGRAATLKHLQATAMQVPLNSAGSQHFMSVPNAINELWDALFNKNLVVSGIDPVIRKRRIIDAQSLQDLEIATIGHQDILRTKLTIGVGPVRYTDMTVSSSSVRSLWKNISKSRGRPAKYDWQIIGDHAVRILDQHGGIDRFDNVIPSQAAFERLILDFCVTKLGIHPSESVIRDRIPSFLSRYEKQRAGN